MRQFREPDCFLIFFFTLLIFAPLGITTVPCYYPDRFSVDPSDLSTQPCKYSNGGTYMCCATNRTNPFGGNISVGLTADHCLPNGLCLNSIINSDGSHTLTYWRDTCTASDWSTGGCLNVCLDPKVCCKWTQSLLRCAGKCGMLTARTETSRTMALVATQLN